MNKQRYPKGPAWFGGNGWQPVSPRYEYRPTVGEIVLAVVFVLGLFLGTILFICIA